MPSANSSPIDQRLSVLAQLFRPGLSLCRLMGLSLDDVRELIEVGYVKEFQDRGMSWASIARRLGKSRRTVATLAKRVSEHESLLSGSPQISLQRRIVEQLEQGPTLREELQPPLRGADLDEALGQLVESGVIVSVARGNDPAEHFVLGEGPLDVIGEGMRERLGALQHFLETVTTAVHQRFFTRSKRDHAFVRTLTFQVTEDRLRRLIQELYADAEERVFSADKEAAHQEAVTASLSLVVARAPSDPRLRP